MQGDWLVRRVTLLEHQVEQLNSLPSEVTALRHALVLHEEVISLIATMGEQRNRPRLRPRKKR